MQILRNDNRLEIVLFKPEAYLLRASLEQVSNNYQADLSDIPHSVKEHWFQNSKEMDSEDYELWLLELRQFRGDNAKLAERLIGSLSGSDSWPLVLPLSIQEADTFLTLINDHRLYLAATNDLGPEDMDREFDIMGVSPKEMAIMSIHFLAWLMELLIMRLDDDHESRVA